METINLPRTENDSSFITEVNSLDLANKPALSKSNFDYEENQTVMEINAFDCKGDKNSLQRSEKFDNLGSGAGSDCEECITGMKLTHRCDKSSNVFKYEKTRSALNLEHIYDISKYTLGSKKGREIQSESSDELDEETLAMFEPIVKCEVSDEIIDLYKIPRTEFELNRKYESRGVINFDKSKNVLVAPIKCSLCDTTFKSEKRYERHLIKHSQNEKIECNMCGKAFPNNRFLRHIMVHTGEKPHCCKICGRGFRLKRDLKQHSFTHTGERPYPCKMCGKKFADSSARRKHYQTHTGEKPYTCELCQRAFTQISHLREHQVTHTREKGHTCDMCEKKFTTKSSLQRHVLTHINCCEICGETFTTSTKLDRHKELHDTSRAYSCPYCTRRFVKKTDVNTHVLIHSEVKDIFCKICNGAFKSYRYLRVHHYHYHSGMEPPFVCPVCKKGFFQEMSLQKHSVAHIPKKRVKCFECKKVFATPEILEEHICVQDIYFSCELCDRKYRHKSDLNKHVRKFHN